MKIIIFLLLLFAMAPISKGQDIYIENIEVSNKYNSTYILSYANLFLYKVEYVDKEKIERVLNELKLSGLFKEIKWSLVKTKGQKSYLLKIKPKNKTNYQDIVIDEVVLDGFPEIDKGIFLDNLKKEGVLLKSTWVSHSFRNLLTKIRNALRDSSNFGQDRDSLEVPWVTIRKSSSAGIKLIVHKDAPSFTLK